MEYRICKRCIMDTTSDPGLILDKNGVCNYCHEYDVEVQKMRKKSLIGENSLQALFDKIKNEEKNKRYDCMIGISGGVDSSYMLWLASQYGMRILAVSVDTGWNNPVADSNVDKICKKLNIKLHVIKLDTQVFDEIQRAYMFSGLANVDIPQDQAIFAVCDKMAKKYNIKYVLNGYNLATEGILSTAYQYANNRDWISIKGVYKQHGRTKIIGDYPHRNFIQLYFWDPYVNNIHTIYPLQYIDYSKTRAIELLEREFGWEYYGGKHYESILTKFIQQEYLPKRYGWYKVRDHISSLIVGGELTREQGLKEMEKAISDIENNSDEIDYVLKRLDISKTQWQNILKAPYKMSKDYPSSEGLIKICSRLKRLIVGEKNR